MSTPEDVPPAQVEEHRTATEGHEEASEQVVEQVREQVREAEEVADAAAEQAAETIQETVDTAVETVAQATEGLSPEDHDRIADQVVQRLRGEGLVLRPIEQDHQENVAADIAFDESMQQAEETAEVVAEPVPVETPSEDPPPAPPVEKDEPPENTHWYYRKIRRGKKDD